MIIFQTPTDLDFTALTTFGLSAKETDHPIGRFGTGLKYALAVLAREGAEITIQAGQRRIRIEREEREFRGQPFGAVVATPVHEPRFDMPFTTQLGRDWELWQAFRELYSNTLDENGSIYREAGAPAARDGVTSIIVAHADFEAVYDERATIIIEDAPLWENDDIAIYEGKSGFMFYRGIRARELVRPAAFRYSVKKEIDLTEDRTIKYHWEADDIVAHALAECNDQHILERALGHGAKTFEAEYNWMQTTPGETFARAVTSIRGRDETAAPATAVAAVAKPVETGDQAPQACHLSDENRARLVRVVEVLETFGVDAKSIPMIAVGALPGGVSAAAERGKIYLADTAFETDEKMAHALIRSMMEMKAPYVSSWAVDRLVAAWRVLDDVRNAPAQQAA